MIEALGVLVIIVAFFISIYFVALAWAIGSVINRNDRLMEMMGVVLKVTSIIIFLSFFIPLAKLILGY